MRSERIQIHAHVESSDLVEIAQYIAKDNPQAALRVLEAIERTFLRLASFPDSGTEYHAARTLAPGLRMTPVEGFRQYLIFYRPLLDKRGIRVLYVMHAAREQGSVIALQKRE